MISCMQKYIRLTWLPTTDISGNLFWQNFYVAVIKLLAFCNFVCLSRSVSVVTTVARFIFMITESGLNQYSLYLIRDFFDKFIANFFRLGLRSCAVLLRHVLAFDGRLWCCCCRGRRRSIGWQSGWYVTWSVIPEVNFFRDFNRSKC